MLMVEVLDYWSLKLAIEDFITILVLMHFTFFFSEKFNSLITGKQFQFPFVGIIITSKIIFT